jgi:hypothetical protein
MRATWRVYWAGLKRHGVQFAGGAFLGALGLAFTIHPIIVPAWFWFLVALASVAWLGFVVFHDYRMAAVASQAAMEARIRDLSSAVDSERQREGVEKLLSSLIWTGRILELMVPITASHDEAMARINDFGSDCTNFLTNAFGVLESTRFVEAVHNREVVISKAEHLSLSIQALMSVADRIPNMTIRKDFDPVAYEEGITTIKASLGKPASPAAPSGYEREDDPATA